MFKCPEIPEILHPKIPVILEIRSKKIGVKFLKTLKPGMKSVKFGLKSMKPDLNALNSGLKLLEYFKYLQSSISLESLKSFMKLEIPEIRPEILKSGLPAPKE